MFPYYPSSSILNPKTIESLFLVQSEPEKLAEDEEKVPENLPQVEDISEEITVTSEIEIPSETITSEVTEKVVEEISEIEKELPEVESESESEAESDKSELAEEDKTEDIAEDKVDNTVEEITKDNPEEDNTEDSFEDKTENIDTEQMIIEEDQFVEQAERKVSGEDTYTLHLKFAPKIFTLEKLPHSNSNPPYTFFLPS